MPIPSPVRNKTRPNYLVIDGRLTNAGKSFLKILSVYSKVNKAYRESKVSNSSKPGLTPNKKAGLKQIMGKYSGKASLSTITK